MCAQVDSVFVEAPALTALAQFQSVAVQRLYFQPYVGERFHAVYLLHHGGVLLCAVDGDALYEEAVAAVLELAEHFCFVDDSEPAHRAGEADEVGVGTRHAPLS